MSMLKIALLKIAPCQSLDENLEKGIACCKKAKEIDEPFIRSDYRE